MVPDQHQIFRPCSPPPPPKPPSYLPRTLVIHTPLTVSILSGNSTSASTNYKPCLLLPRVSTLGLR